MSRRRWHGRKSRAGRDPGWIDARYPGVCGARGCGAEIAAGDRVFWYPSSRTVLGSRCGHGEAAARDFEAARFDEAVYGGGGA